MDSGDNQDKERMASSVTRHALNPVIEDYKLLLYGIDSLDLGLYVKWLCDWDEFIQTFDKAKEDAQASDGYLDQTPEGRDFVHFPTGKAPNYRFHIQFPEYNLFIAKTAEAGHSPNLYLSLNSETIWRLGMQDSVAVALNDIAGFGGVVEKIQPSRCDFCADFKLPSGLTDEFLKSHSVSRSRDADFRTKNNRLETFYSGSVRAPIRLRIYDKGKEILKTYKSWFYELWGTDDNENIWRVEFQVRRPLLKQFRVQTLDDLKNGSFGIWKYLTEDWFSLRIPDNEKQERRTIHPLWKMVQECADKFGPSMEVQRMLQSELSATDKWYVSHIAGCLPSWAARCGVKDVERAIKLLIPKLCLYWKAKSFEEEFLKRSIKLGLSCKLSERNDEEE